MRQILKKKKGTKKREREREGEREREREEVDGGNKKFEERGERISRGISQKVVNLWKVRTSKIEAKTPIQISLGFSVRRRYRKAQTITKFYGLL